MYSDHRIVTAEIQLSLRANKSVKAKPRYNWSILNGRNDVSREFSICLKSKFSALQDNTDNITENITYDNFVEACKTAAEEHIPLKPKIRRRVPWENENVQEKRLELENFINTQSKKPTRSNTTKLRNARNKLKETYATEQKKYIESKIQEIKDASDNKQSATAWQIVNEISGRKSSNRAKLKANSNEERIQLWQNHFQNLYGKPPNITKVLTRRIIDQELDIKIGPFTTDELVKTREKVKRGKACPDDGVPPELWATGYFDNELLQMRNMVYDQLRIQRWQKGQFYLFLKKETSVSLPITEVSP